MILSCKGCYLSTTSTSAHTNKPFTWLTLRLPRTRNPHRQPGTDLYPLRHLVATPETPFVPISFHINAEDGLINLQADAALTSAELHRCGERLLAADHFDPSLPQLIDLRAAKLNALCSDDEPAIRALVERYNEQVDGSVAVLIDASEAGEHLADAYRVTCALPRAELFDRYDEAMRWLIKQAFVPANRTRSAPAPAGAIRPSGQEPDSAG